jgi:hypothetical protein
VKRAALLATVIVLATTGYAVAGGPLRIIRLHSGQSVRIGTVKVIAVGKTRVVTQTAPGTTRVVTETVTAPGTTRVVTETVTAPGTTTAPSTNVCTSPVPYPGDDATREAIAQWMALGARARRVPGELPVMAALVASGLKNLSGGDRDEAGYFGMRIGIWNAGKYAGFADHPDLQLIWFIDQALAVWASRVAAGNLTFGNDPQRWGEWVADTLRPAEQYRGRYQLRLDEARNLIGASCTGTG